MQDIQVAVFLLEDKLFGFESCQVHTIIKYQKVEDAADIPDFAEQVTNWRGIIIPIINLGKRWGMGKGEISKKTKIIVSRVNEKLIGFKVDDVVEVRRFPAQDIEPVPKVLFKNADSYLKAIGKIDEKLILIPDLENLLTESEKSSLKKCQRDK